MKGLMKTSLVIVVWSILLSASGALAADGPKLALEGKFDGRQVKLRWMMSDQALDYDYVLWRAPANDPSRRTRLAQLKMLDYAAAQQRLADHRAALKLMYPFEAAESRSELNQSLAQADNRLGMLLFLSMREPRIAAALGQYFVDEDPGCGQALVYTVEARRDGRLVAGGSLILRLDKATPLPMLWAIKAHRFAWGVGLKWQGYEPYVFFNIYRATSHDGAFERINKAPVQVQTSKNADGTESVAPYFFTDTALKQHERCYYRIAGVDLFGDEGPVSIAVAGEIRTDPRPAPELQAGETAINILWQPSADRKVVAYNVYRSLKYEGGYRKLNARPVEGTRFSDRSVRLDTNYFYYVTALNQGGFESMPSLAVLGLAKDVTPPGAVQKLSAEVVGADIHLAWAMAPDADLRGYRVYRTMRPDDLDWALLNREPLANPAYSDGLSKNLSRHPYYYRVTAVDTHNNESQPSAPVKIQLPDVTAPAVPALSGYSVHGRQVSLSWRPVADYDVAGYNVYRQVAGRRTKLTATPLTLPSFVDRTPPVGQPLHYAVTAIDRAGNESPPSSPVRVTAADATAPRIASFDVAVEGTKVALSVVSNDEDSAGFDVFRSRNRRDFVKINPSRVRAAGYTDRVLAGRRYFYKVVLWDTSANRTESVVREVKLPR
jgi:fibronectin type 3 domain-containing protein